MRMTDWEGWAAFGGPWGLIMLVLAIVLVGTALYVARGRRPEGEFSSAMPDLRDAHLARLERERREGRMTEDEYARRRRDLGLD